MMLIGFISKVFCCLCLISGCAFKFRNSERSLDLSLKQMYVPSVRDHSSLGAGISRSLSQSLRQSLSLNTRYALVSIEEAKVGLHVEVLDVRNKVLEVSLCLTPGQVIGGGAVSCASPDFNRADSASETEQMSAVVVARLIDLRTGAILFQKRYETAGSFSVIGDLTMQAQVQGQMPCMG